MTGEEEEVRLEGWRSLAADVALSLATPWLALWRAQVPLNEAARGGWTSWWPLGVGGGLVVLGILIGFASRARRGYMPYALRWILLVGAILLAAWTSAEVAMSRPTRAGAQRIAERSKERAAAAVEAAQTPKEQRIARQAVSAADGVERFGELLDAAAAAGIDVPAPANATADSSVGEQAAALLTEYGEDLAVGTMPLELAEMADQLGLSGDDFLMQAGIALASHLLAQHLGMPYLAIIKIAVELLADGEVTAGDLIRLGTSVALSVDSGGSINPDLLAQQFDKVGRYAETMSALMDKAETLGLDEQVGTEVWTWIKDAANEVAGAPRDRVEPGCDAAAVARVLRTVKTGSDEQVRALGMSDNAACRRLTTEQRAQLLDATREASAR